MSKITASPDVDQVKNEEFSRFCSIFNKNVQEMVNGNLDFQNNFNCKVISMSFSAINTDTAAVHNLGRVLSSYFVISKSAACDVYNGTSPATANLIYLKGTAVANVTLVVF